MGVKVMPQWEVIYQLKDKAIQVTLINSDTKQNAFSLIEEELMNLDMGYRILDITRVN